MNDDAANLRLAATVAALVGCLLGGCKKPDERPAGPAGAAARAGADEQGEAGGEKTGPKVGPEQLADATAEKGPPELPRLPVINPKYPAAAVRKAGPWLASFDPAELRFDAAIGLHALRTWADTPELERAYENAVAVARRDADNPLLPLAGVDYDAPAAAVTSWTAPAAGEKRVNVNRVIAEAAHCKAHGLRDQTLSYLAGPMRDGGGYQSTHAAWALVVARSRGCVDQEPFDTIAGDLRAELASALAGADEPKSTLDIDLMAERVLMLAMLGHDPRYLTASAVKLIELQGADGSWGVAPTTPDGERATNAEPAYYRYHATLVATWALALLIGAPAP